MRLKSDSVTGKESAEPGGEPSGTMSTSSYEDVFDDTGESGDETVETKSINTTGSSLAVPALPLSTVSVGAAPNGNVDQDRSVLEDAGSVRFATVVIPSLLSQDIGA